MGRQPAVIVSNDDASPSLRAAGFATHLRDALPWHLGTGFVSGCIDVPDYDLYTCTSPWTHDLQSICRFSRVRRCNARPPGAWAILRGPSGSRLRRRVGHGAIYVPLLEPSGLRVNAGYTHAGASAPRAGHAAGGATEVRDHLTAAATGHTLPRLMGCRLQTLALASIAAVAWHQPFRLAFRA